MGNTNALIFDVNALWHEVLPEGMELALRLHLAGRQVFWVRCRSDLMGCASNPQHLYKTCNKCTRESSYSSKHLLGQTAKTLNINFSTQLNKFDIDAEFRRFTVEAHLYTYEDFPLGSMVVSQMTDDSRDLLDRSLLGSDRARQLVEMGICLYLWSEEVIREHAIDEVYVWNGRRPSDGPVWWAARKLGVEAWTFISGHVQNTVLLLDKPSVQYTDFEPLNYHELFTGDVTHERDAITDYISAYRMRSHTMTGFQAFHDIDAADSSGETNSDAAQVSNKVTSQGPKLERPTLVFYSSSVWEFAGINPYRFGDADSSLGPASILYSAITDLLLDQQIQSGFDTIVRWHPNLRNAGDSERKLIDSIVASTPQVTHYLPESPVSSYRLLDSADVVVTTGSTIGIEAAHAGKLVIEFCAGFAHRWGATYRAGSVLEVVSLLERIRDGLEVHDRRLTILGAENLVGNRLKLSNKCELVKDGMAKVTGDSWLPIVSPHRRLKKNFELGEIKSRLKALDPRKK